ncbi:hypothetical protein GCM10010319_50150 [Streptomyces blastmyceticus]|uniref:Uncharacterized protein n=1 Tax=Streptomyces blastmyceticus TaxID=68180 RepID=A0ABP3HB47_9ACTN
MRHESTVPVVVSGTTDSVRWRNSIVDNRPVMAMSWITRVTVEGADVAKQAIIFVTRVTGAQIMEPA